jgi:hypothetical protein
MCAQTLAVRARTRIVTVAIALLIALPVLRVLLMLVVFVRERDFLFSAIAMLVLAIILLGSVLGGAACARYKNVCPQTGARVAHRIVLPLNRNHRPTALHGEVYTLDD